MIYYRAMIYNYLTVIRPEKVFFFPDISDKKMKDGVVVTLALPPPAD